MEWVLIVALLIAEIRSNAELVSFLTGGKL